MTTFTFPVFPLSLYQQAGQTSIKRPKEFAYFSFDDSHHCTPFSTESLRYYYPPFFASPGTQPPVVNLSSGFDTWIKADPLDHHLDGLLETIRAYEEQQQQQQQHQETTAEDVKVEADVITWRGIMTKILTAPYDMFSDFEMNATCYHGTIYIEDNHEYKLANEQNSNAHAAKGGKSRGHRQQSTNPSQEMMQYWGYKFEELCVLKRPWPECTREEIVSRDREVINNNSQYCSIARTGIGSTSLVIGGEVDCVLGEKPSDPEASIPWIELKTTADVPNESRFERQKFERKLLKFWAQSFLLNVPKIVVGYRTPQGFLARIEEFETQKLPGFVSRGERTWDGNTCISFAAAFLEFLRGTLIGREGVWRIKRAKGDPSISISQVEQEGTGEILRPEFKAHRENLKLAAGNFPERRTEPEIETENDL